jgi:hypothetical protein
MFRFGATLCRTKVDEIAPGFPYPMKRASSPRTETSELTLYRKPTSGPFEHPHRAPSALTCIRDPWPQIGASADSGQRSGAGNLCALIQLGDGSATRAARRPMWTANGTCRGPADFESPLPFS